MITGCEINVHEDESNQEEKKAREFAAFAASSHRGHKGYTEVTQSAAFATKIRKEEN